MKIRIFALAKELDMDSKVLIKHCNDAGVQVKSSALASISPEERDIVLKHLEQAKGGSSPVAESAPQAPTREPTREPTRDMSTRVREIKTMAPRTQPSLSRPARTETVAADDRSTASAVAEPTDDVAAEVADVETEPDVEAESTPATSTAAETAAPEPEVAASVEQEEENVETVADDAPADVVEKVEPTKKTVEVVDDGPAPISRDDYVSVSGASGSSIREMKPRGTTADTGTRQARRPKSRPKTALPNFAAPPTQTFPKAKASKADEAPAQEPDVRLTTDILEHQSPLAAHLRKHAEQKKGRVGIDESETDSEVKRPIGRQAAGSLGLVEARQQRRERRKQAKNISEDDASSVKRGRGPRRRRSKSSAPVDLKTAAQIEFPITIRGLSEAMGRPANALIKSLFIAGKMATINDNIDEETALELALEFGVDLDIKRGRDIEEELARSFEPDEPDELAVDRPPVITILGHVDHGKTSLLDKIRSADVAAGEAGGITQHIASYQVEHNGKKLTFVDTPGHAAFGAMRARGADVTDIIILVVAADDGVMPQTVECISHAKASGAPIIVALNKIDLPDTNQEKILADLAAHDVVASEWGGDIEVVRTSAESGQGIDDLLETLLLTAELHELKANPDRPAVGVCLEAFRDEGRGAIAWLIVQKGTLRIGDVVLCGNAYGRIRAMYNDRDEEIEEAAPSQPVKVAGLNVVPGAGDHFYVLGDIEEARTTAEDREHQGRTQALSGRGQPRTLDDILNAAKTGAVQDLPLILKADTPGSIEALRGEIQKLEHPEVRVKILHEGVGGVNESDVYLASASGAIIVAFHVIAEDRAMILADAEGVEIRRYNIIYEVTNHIKQSLEGMLIPERREVPTGRALVLQTFQISRFGTIAGCRILSGTIERSNRVHVIRDQKVINDYHIASLKREKDDAKEVRDGMECGIRLDGFNDVKEGDLLEAFRIDQVKRTLD